MGKFQATIILPVFNENDSISIEIKGILGFIPANIQILLFVIFFFLIGHVLIFGIFPSPKDSHWIHNGNRILIQILPLGIIFVLRLLFWNINNLKLNRKRRSQCVPA